MESPGDEIFPVSLRQLIDSTQRIPVIYGICDKESVLGFVRKSMIQVLILFQLIL